MTIDPNDANQEEINQERKAEHEAESHEGIGDIITRTFSTFATPLVRESPSTEERDEARHATDEESRQDDTDHLSDPA